MYKNCNIWYILDICNISGYLVEMFKVEWIEKTPGVTNIAMEKSYLKLHKEKKGREKRKTDGKTKAKLLEENMMLLFTK